MDYRQIVTAKRQTAAQQQQQSSQLQQMLDELKKMQLAALMGTQGKTTVIPIDQTGLGDKMQSFADTIEQAILSTDTSDVSQSQLDYLKQIKAALADVTAAIRSTAPDSNAGVIKAIQALKLNPAITVQSPDVHVPTPVVHIPAPIVDVAPITAVLRDMRPESVPIADDTPQPSDLSRYKAQDLQDGDDKQYIGFMNPEGYWYIVENDVKGNSMRYLFGRTGYGKAFSSASSWQYQTLDKAIDALTA